MQAQKMAKMAKNRAFILSYGRPERVRTWDLFSLCAPDLELWVVVGDDEPYLERYRERFGERLIVFNKASAKKALNIDLMGCFDWRVPVFARCAVNEIARSRGWKDYLLMDDDYKGADFLLPDGRRVFVKGSKSPVERALLAKAIDLSFELLRALRGRVGGVCWSQCGDVFDTKRAVVEWRHKCMNMIFANTDYPILWRGGMNEDVNASINPQGLDKPFLCIGSCLISQESTQKDKGGMTSAYLAQGTFVKSALSAMLRPDCVKIGILHSRFGNKRIHHKIENICAYPRIIREDKR